MNAPNPPTINQVHLLQINPVDNVAVAIVPLAVGHQEIVGGVTVTVQQDVSLGAKLALRPIASGEKIVKFGEPIGSASREIASGEYVHTHNLQSDYLPTTSHTDKVGE